MGIFDDARDSLKKYSGIVIDKTETLAKQAKISLEINNLNEKIHVARAELGEYILNKKHSGKKSLSLDDDYIGQIAEKIKKLENEISRKRETVNSLQKKETPPVTREK